MFKRFTRRSHRRCHNPAYPPLPSAPIFEALESRLLLSGTHFIVNTLTDGPANAADNLLTLREAIEAANNNDLFVEPNLADLITFDQTALSAEANVAFGDPLTITLDGTELTISDDLVIQGLGADVLTIDADGQSRVFWIWDFETIGVDLSGLTITGGRASNSGGGIGNNEGLTLTNSTVIGNSASNGGGIFNQGALTLVNSTVKGNSAEHNGGGIYNAGVISQDRTLTAINTTVIGNTSSSSGGGIYNEKTLTLTNTTVAGNSATSFGGGIFTSNETVTLNNTIVALNEATTAASIYGAAIHHNSLIGVDPSFFRNPSAGPDNAWGTSDDDYGDLRVTDASLAINHGDNALALDHNGQPLTMDLDGNSRVTLGLVDAGAFEYQGAPSLLWQPPSTLVTTLVDVIDTTDGERSIREAIVYAGLLNQDVLFAPHLSGGTISLDHQELSLHQSVVIDASSIDGLSINAGNQSRVIYIAGNNTEVSLYGVTLTGGSTTGVGGGIFNDNGTLMLINSTVSGNSSNSGGGIYSGGALTLTGSTIANNTSSGWGGGILSSRRLTLIASTVSNNSAAGKGGGIYLGQSFPTTITHSTVSGNSAGSEGGGIHNHVTTITMTNSTVAGNSASIGGGVYNYGTLAMINSTLSGNSANSGGGAYNAIGTLTVSNSTLVGNLADENGGVYNAGTLTLNNAIVALNEAATEANVKNVGTITTNSSLIATDPHFVRNPFPGADDTWGTEDDDYGDLRLQPISPAIDTGDNTLLPPDTADLDGDTDTAETLSLDLGLNPRIYGGTVDIGAYEAQAFMLGDLNGDDILDPADADLLSKSIHANSDEVLYDLNADNQVNALDGLHLIQNLLGAHPADFNLDGQVDVADLSTWATGFGSASLYTQGDANFDGQVDVQDLSIWATNFGKTSTAPAPIALPLTQTTSAVADASEEPAYLFDSRAPTMEFDTPDLAAGQDDRWGNITGLINRGDAEKDKKTPPVLDIIQNLSTII